MIAIAIHGGAGAVPPGESSAERQHCYRAQLHDTLDAAYALLAGGALALDAAVTAVRTLEDCGLFNAGRGAVYTHAGGHELDAAVMEGSSMAAGAVCCVRNLRNPVLLARRVLEYSPHVLLAGAGAEAFARAQGAELMPDEYFDSARRWTELQEARAHESATGALGSAMHYGTVGAVALDHAGGLAAATSTGGTTNKREGRVGDSPLIGAGTYADDTCAVSATGSGEYFIRVVAAHELAARIAHCGTAPDAAARAVLARIAALGGAGGMIAVDRSGRVAMEFNTPAMYRAAVDARGARQISVLR